MFRSLQSEAPADGCFDVLFASFDKRSLGSKPIRVNLFHIMAGFLRQNSSPPTKDITSGPPYYVSLPTGINICGRSTKPHNPKPQTSNRSRDREHVPSAVSDIQTGRGMLSKCSLQIMHLLSDIHLKPTGYDCSSHGGRNLPQQYDYQSHSHNVSTHHQNWIPKYTDLHLRDRLVKENEQKINSGTLM